MTTATPEPLSDEELDYWRRSAQQGDGHDFANNKNTLCRILATLDHRVAQATKAERERCAGICDNQAASDDEYAAKYPDEARQMQWFAHRARVLAQAIRSTT